MIREWLEWLYAQYVQEWKNTHEFSPGDCEPACFAEWYQCEFMEALDEFEENYLAVLRRAENDSHQSVY